MKLHIAIPLLNELENLPALMQDLSAQDGNFKVYFCVNQPEEWWNDGNKLPICENNLESMQYIRQHADFSFEIIDRSSRGKAWEAKKSGVGWARKTLTDRILELADNEDIIISLDGDTRFAQHYFQSIAKRMREFPTAPALSVPYYHKLTGQNAEDRAILRYEIYMRYYLIQLFRIGSPYAFTALGSAMAMRVWALRKIGGMSPKKSGEDFYLLQKIIKYRPVLQWNDEMVYPAARFSNRVFFGTGPAMIKGNEGDWSSYPIYPEELFDEIREFYRLIPKLYRENISTSIDRLFNNPHRVWDSLRKNSKDLPHFTKAVHDKFDGLRILQFLKQHPNMANHSDDKTLIRFLKNRHAELVDENFSFDIANIQQLNAIRDYLCDIEKHYRKQSDLSYGT